MPTVTIIIPLFNRAQYLPQAITSILRQGYEDFEVIIVDDGSTESVRAVVEECILKCPAKIRFISQQNRGPGGARNYGIKESKGQYIAFLDADDEWEENFLAKVMGKLTSGSYEWVDTAAYRVLINEKEEIIEKTIIHGELTIPNGNLFAALLKENIIGSPSKVVCKKECFEKVGLFREDYRLLEDWDLWLRLAKAKCQWCHISEPLYQYKIRQNSLTKTESLNGMRYTYKLLCAYSRDAFRMDPDNRVLYADKMWNLARHLLRSPKKDAGLFLKCLVRSQIYSPSVSRILKSSQSLMTGTLKGENEYQH